MNQTAQYNATVPTALEITPREIADHQRRKR